jgi:hypothetical protein
MPVDLSTQTRDLFTRIDERQEPIGLTEITALAQTTTDTPPTPVVAGVDVDSTAGSHPVVKRSWWRNVGVAAAAAAVVLLVVGGVAWLSRSVATDDPADQSTTTTAATTTTSTALNILIPESLTRPQMEHQVEFLEPFRELGYLAGGGCAGNDPGPYECDVTVYSPTLGGPTTLEFTVTDQDPGGRDPGEVSGPDDMQQSSMYGAAVREVAEDGLGALYLWALESNPEETEAQCQVGFTGDDNNLAWSPGYITDYACGQHLAGLLDVFAPDEALPALELAASAEPGVWYPVVDPLDGADAERWDHVLFDLATTPYGFIGTSGQGLWISQDGLKWEQYARDMIEFGPGGESFARIASSSLGILVIEPITDPEAWFTSNRTTWRSVEIEDLLQEGQSVRIAANEDTFVVESRGQIWTSANGIDWVEVNVGPAAAECGFYTLEATPFGFIAGGSNGAGDQRRPVVCTSVDGIEWTKPAELEKIRAAGDSIVDVAGSDLGVVAAGISGAAWYSPDGATWTQVLPPQTRTRGGEGAVGASDLGFIIALDDWLDDTDALVLESRDGISWSPVTYLNSDDPLVGRFPAIAGDLGMIMREVVPYRDGFLIATESTPSPVHIYEP